MPVWVNSGVDNAKYVYMCYKPSIYWLHTREEHRRGVCYVLEKRRAEERREETHNSDIEYMIRGL